jgi:DNA (cytosine-5)-methyltransferase 1
MNCEASMASDAPIAEPGLVLSLFPGVGLLDLAFEEHGFSVVRGPDLIHGGDVERWRIPPAGTIRGVIAGPPCQGFSCANGYRLDESHPSVQRSLRLLEWTVKAIERIRPEWWLIENVPNVPNVCLSGYTTQRLAINDFECGGLQIRWRAIQFGHVDGFHLRPKRVNDRAVSRRIGRKPIAITTKPASKHQTFAEQCRRQGLAKPLELPGWSKQAKFRAIGNGVPLSIGRVLAAAVRECSGPANETDCVCGCGRPVAGGRHRSATPACRKRLQLRRDLLAAEK